MERAHGELRARLADGLRRDDAHGLALVDAIPPGQVSPIALRADAVAGRAGDGRSNQELIDGRGFQFPDRPLIQQRARLQHHRFGARRQYVNSRNPAENTFPQRLDHVTALHQGRHHQSFIGTAVHVRDHQVLRHVHQATGQVTGVGGLQRRVGETLARAVRGNEVLQDVQALAEIGGNGRFDDRAVRLRHQPAHARELANLGGRAPRTGVGHHVDGIEGLLPGFIALGVEHALRAQFLHHRLGDMVVGSRPDIHDLVVPLAIRDQSGCVLILDLLHLLLGDLENAVLLLGDHHVVDPEGNARVSRIVEAHVHELVGKDDRRLQAQLPVAGVDDRRNGALVHGLIDQVEAQTLGHDLRQQRAAHGRVHQPRSRLLVRLGIGVHDGHPYADLRVQVHRIVLVGAMDLLHPGKQHALAAGVDALAGHVIEAQHDVLGGHDDRVAVGRRKDVIAGHHQRACF